MALDEDMALLARQPLLSLMERDALRLLAFAAESRILRAGDVLFRAGEPSDGAVLVVSGAVALTVQDDGKPATEIIGLKEVAKLLGYDSPQKIDINITASLQSLKEHIGSMDDEALAQLAGADRVLDADFYRIEKRGAEK